MKPLQVVILAGGLGTRLKPLTEQCTKVMVPIHGIPFLEYQIAYLKKHGFFHILLLVGYRGHQVEEYFGDGSKWNVTIDYSYEKELLGTGGALRLAENKLENSFVLVNGDTFYPLDYPAFLERACKIRKGGLIAVYDNIENVAPNNVCVDAQGHIVAYSKTSQKKMNGVDGGVSFYYKDILECIPLGRKVSLEESVYPLLMAKEILWAHFTNQRYYDMGTLERLETLEKHLSPISK